MDLEIIALAIQEVFLILYGPLLFWSLVFTIVTTLGLVIVLPFLSVSRD
jgi:hypothetical protein